MAKNKELKIRFDTKLYPSTMALLETLANKHGLTSTAVVEVAIREKARRERVKLPEKVQA